MSFTSLLAKFKFRFDLGLSFLTFVNFSLLIVATSDKLQRLLRIDSRYYTYWILGMALPLAFLGTFLFGYILDKFRYQHNLITESNKRNVELTEILQIVKDIKEKQHETRKND